MVNLDILLERIDFLISSGREIGIDEYEAQLGFVREDFEWLWGVAFGD